MISFLKLFFYYKIGIFKYLFGLISSPGVFNDALKNNFNHPTFRFPQKAITDLLISVKIYRSLFKGAFQQQKYIAFNNNSSLAIFDSDLRDVELRTNYIEKLEKEKVKLFLGRSELKNSTGFLLSFFTVFICLLSFPFSFLISILSVNKLKVPLHILSTVECFNLLSVLRKNKISKLHFFCIYENDANLIAFVLMKCGIEINKIPSEVPLSFWNRTVIADTLSFCFKYQQDEYNLYKNTMHVKGTQHWVPENSFNSERIYNRKTYDLKSGTIGFYSSGMWLREKLGQVNLKDDAYLNEQSLLNLLLDFSNKNSQYKLVVFLHPLEKKNLEEAKAYYNNLAKNIEFANVNQPNSEQFYNADVAVTLFSTLSYERLFWGFKTIIYPLGKDHFPIRNSTFNSVCAKTEVELREKLKAALETDNKTFFLNNGLSDYRYSDYSIFKNEV